MRATVLDGEDICTNSAEQHVKSAEGVTPDFAERQFFCLADD